MSEYIVQDTTLTAIADAVRAKKGTTEPIALTDFAAEIESIQSGEDWGSNKLPLVVGLQNDFELYDITADDLRGMKIIPERYFENRAGLRNVVIPEGVVYIGSEAFQGCEFLETVVIPKSTIKIGNGVFFGCKNLKSIHYLGDITEWCTIDIDGTLCNEEYDLYVQNVLMSGDVSIPDGVKKISNLGRTGIKTITVPSSVTSIGEYAFYECTSLTSVTIGDSVTTIGDYAFNSCYSLASVTFGENSQLTSIGMSAFSNCNSLTSVVVPASVVSIGDSALNSVDIVYNFSNVEIDHNNVYVITENDSLIVADDGVIAYITSESGKVVEYKKLSPHVEIPHGVTTINSGIFTDDTSILSLKIPSTVATIEDDAFEDCENLKTVTIENNSQLTSVGKYSFSGCINLKDFFFGNNSNLTTISDRAFSGCLNLSTISFGENSRLSSIGNYAFADCRKLTKFTVPSSVVSIGNYSFQGCFCLVEVQNLSNLNILAGDTSFGYIAQNALNIYAEDSNSLLSIDESGYSVYSDGEEKILVTYLGDDKDLIIPDDITKIKSNAFYYSKIQSIAFGEESRLHTIGKNAFYSSSFLLKITVPSHVSTIEEGAFNWCNSLIEVYNCSSIALTAGSSSDGKVAYYAKNVYTPTQGVSKITLTDDGLIIYDNYKVMGHNGKKGSVIIPSTITEIKEDAFSGSTALEAVGFESDAQITTIGNSSFRNCYGLKTISFPNSVTKIDYYAFSGCSSLTNVTFEKNSNLKTIGGYAFDGCNLSVLVLPPSLESTAYYAFSKAVKNTYYLGTIEDWIKISFSSNYGTPLNNKESDLYIDGKPVTEIIIPDGVESIGYGTFYHMKSLKTLVLPSSITRIYDKNFMNIQNVARTVYYKGTYDQWNSIEWGSAISVEYLYINGELATSYYCTTYDLDYIPNKRFLKEIIFSKNVSYFSSTSTVFPQVETIIFEADSKFTSLDRMEYFPSLKTINIPKNVNSFSYGVFSDCRELQSVVFEEGCGLSSISGFGGCISLSSINIETLQSLSTLSYGTFSSCISLKEIIIPENVTYIEGYALGFRSRFGDTTFIFKSINPPSFDWEALGEFNANVRIIVPPGSADAYKTATNLSEYADYIEEATE